MKLFDILRTGFCEVYIQIHGRETVLFEGYSKIEEYTETRIRLVNSTDRVSVRGSGLRLRHISSERVAIDGRIDAVEFV